MEYSSGTLLWAHQRNYPWWPGVVHDAEINGPESVKNAKHGNAQICIRFLGYDSVAESTLYVHYYYDHSLS